MKHRIHQEGLSYRLRPLNIDDAEFVINVRLEDGSKNKYINSISDNIDLQRNWIEEYLTRDGDYYFVIENALSGVQEGLVGIYNAADGRAEWGRWVVAKGSLAAVESIDLVYKVAFNVLCLDELYCRTITKNKSVVLFHDNLPQMRRGVIEDYVDINGESYDVVEHYVTPSYYENEIQIALENKTNMLFRRNIRLLFGELKFHHIGVACDDIEKEFNTFRMLGYEREGVVFEDPLQGIKGMFIVRGNQPRLELLENLPESNTLTKWLETKNKMYHFAYQVRDIEKAINVLGGKRVKIMSPLKKSTYFGTRICFLMLPNRFMIELIEE